MKILVPFGRAELGGSQLSFLHLADLFRDDPTITFSVWLFEQGPLAQELREQDIPVEILPRSLVRTPWGFRALRCRLREMAPDLIYLHASRIVALAAKKEAIPCLERINMTRRPEAGGWARFAWIDRMMTNWNTHVLAVSNAIRDQLLSRGISPAKITVVRNTADPEHFYRPDLREPTRRELGLDPADKLVINVGRCVAQKGQLDFVAVAERLAKEDPHWKFLIVGEGPLENEIRAAIQAAGLGSRFRLMGFRKDIEAIYAAADVLLHTAHWEPLANVLLEARAAGLPIVATDVDGTREVLEGYSHFHLVSVNKIEEIANHLQKISQHPRSQTDIASQRTNHKQQISTCFQKTCRRHHLKVSIAPSNDGLVHYNIQWRCPECFVWNTSFALGSLLQNVTSHCVRCQKENLLIFDHVDCPDVLDSQSVALQDRELVHQLMSTTDPGLQSMPGTIQQLIVSCTASSLSRE